MDMAIEHVIFVIYRCHGRQARTATSSGDGTYRRTVNGPYAARCICPKWVRDLLHLRDLPHWPVRATYPLKFNMAPRASTQQVFLSDMQVHR